MLAPKGKTYKEHQAAGLQETSDNQMCARNIKWRYLFIDSCKTGWTFYLVLSHFQYYTDHLKEGNRGVSLTSMRHVRVHMLVLTPTGNCRSSPARGCDSRQLRRRPSTQHSGCGPARPCPPQAQFASGFFPPRFSEARVRLFFSVKPSLPEQRTRREYFCQHKTETRALRSTVELFRLG